MEAARVREYFDRTAGAFDSIYSGRRGPLMRFLDRNLRRDIYERFDLTMKACSDVPGSRVLDVGCGSGRYAIEFALRGASRVVGVDLAEPMLRLANALAGEYGVADRCQFVLGDFLDLDLGARFDYTIAIGVFDYIVDPDTLLHKMASVTDRRLVLSFPSKSPVRQPLRNLRYWWRNCPLYFYDHNDIANLLNRNGFRRRRITKIPGTGYDYVVAVDVG